MKTLEKQHGYDVKATRLRVAKHKDTVKALTIIIRDLSDIKRKYPTGKTTLFELKQVVGSLNKIGRKNPLLSLMELSTTFNPATLKTVIGKLRMIKKKLEHSVRDDASDQKLATAYFQRLMDKLNKDFKSVDSSLTSCLANLRSVTAKLEKAIIDYKDAKNDFSTARSLLAKKRFEFTEGLRTYRKDLKDV